MLYFLGAVLNQNSEELNRGESNVIICLGEEVKDGVDRSRILENTE
jgi:hypothetical protein